MLTLQKAETRPTLRPSNRLASSTLPLRLCGNRLSRVAFQPARCQHTKQDNKTSTVPLKLAKFRTAACSVLLACSAWLAPPVLAMQEFANDLASDVELGLGADMMPDTSIVTMATLVYCSLAFLSIFLQSEEEPNDVSPAPKKESKVETKPKPVSHPPPQQSYSVQSPTSWSSGPAPTPNCPSYHTARVQQLASSATSSVSLAVRDGKYLLEQIMPDHLKAVCAGAAPPSGPVKYPPVYGNLSMRGVEEGEVRQWLHGLVEAYLAAKQKSTGLARETTARVVLNNQEAAVRDISYEVAKEAAIMASINIFNTMIVDPAFAAKAVQPSTGDTIM